MNKTVILGLLLALFGIAFAGQIVSIGESTGGGTTTTTTTTTTTYTEEAPPEETQEEGSSGGFGGLTMENSEGDRINVGGAEGEITPLGEEGSSGGEGTTEGTTGAAGQETSGTQATGGSHSTSTGSSQGTQVSLCETAFVLAAFGLAALFSRIR